MIEPERIVRLVRALVGEATYSNPPLERQDPTADLPYPPELDLENRATVLRLWSGERVAFEAVAEVPKPLLGALTGPVAVVTEGDVLDVLRDVLVDTKATCDVSETCACSTARATRLLAAAGIEVPS